MKYKDKTKEQLINELAGLHQYIEDLALNYVPFMNKNSPLQRQRGIFR